MRQLFILAVVLVSTIFSFGQSSSFDVQKDFIKTICFILKDSTGDRDTICERIEYMTEVTTQWNGEDKKWEKTYRHWTRIPGFWPREDFTKIDSVFFRENYSIEKLVLFVLCNGGEWETIPQNNFLNDAEKKELKRLRDSQCAAYLDISVKNKKGQLQYLSIIVNK